MANFNTKISQIRQDLDGLLTSIQHVEHSLGEASISFAELAQSSKDIGTLTSSIQKLSKFLDSNKSPFLDEIKGRVKDINTELSKLNVRQLDTATTALEANAKAMAAISRAQANTNRNLETAKATIAGVRSELSLLEQQSGKSGNGLEAAVARIQKSLEGINGLNNIGGVVGGLNQLDPTKYNQAADALDRVLATVQALKRANITIDVSAATEGQKLAKRPVQPVVAAPTIELPAAKTASTNQRPPQAAARTIQFATERGVDISQVAGTGARGKVTKEDVLSHLQTSGPTVDPGQAAAKAAGLRNELARRVKTINALDDALAAIETARDQAFQKAVTEHGRAKTSSQRAIARNYLLKGDEPGISPDEKRNRALDFSQIRKNKESDDLEVGFQRQLREITVNTNLPGDLGEFKASDAKLIATLKNLRKAAAEEAQKLSKELDATPNLFIGQVAQRSAQTLRRTIDQTQVATQGAVSPGVSVDYALSALAGHKKENYTGGALPAPREQDLYHDTTTQEYLTKGNKVVGANAQEVANNLEIIKRAVDASPHGIAIVGTTGGDIARATAGDSTFSAKKGQDHVLAVTKNAQGDYVTLEQFGELDKVSPGNRTGSAALGTPIQRRRSLEEVAQSDRVSAVPLITDASKAEVFKRELTNITEPGQSTYSFVKDEQTAQRLGGVVGETCASALARAGQRAGIDFSSNAKLSSPVNIVTPSEVVESARNLARTGGTQGYQPSAIEQIGGNLSEAFKGIVDRLKASFSELSQSLKGVTFGDIFDYIKDLFKAPNTGAAAQESIPEFSIGAGGIRTRAAEFSKNYYRPFQTGLNFFGAGLNSVQEISKGFQNGGPGGLLDIAGGAIKGAHTVANANAYFGLNLLPKGIGETFNQRRSETLLDIVETVVGAKTGYRRGSVDQNYTRLKEKEAPLERAKQDLKDSIASGNLSPEDLTKAHNELAQVSEELRQLRQAITAYRRVIAEEAKRSGGPSTGKVLSEEALKGTVNVPQPIVTGGTGIDPKFAQFLSKEETLISQQAKQSLNKFSEGTGFNVGKGNVIIADVPAFTNILKSLYSEQAIKNAGSGDITKIAGISLPERQGLALSRVNNTDLASASVHEGVHTRVSEAAAAGTPLYDQYGHTDKQTDKLARLSLYSPNLQEAKAIYQGTTDTTTRGVLSNYFENDRKNFTDINPNGDRYYNRPTEQYAYVGQAEITQNEDLKKALKNIYGPDLYDQIAKNLKDAIPDTFGDEALPILRQRYAEFEKEFNQIIKQEAAPEALLGPGELPSLPQAQQPTLAQSAFAGFDGISEKVENKSQQLAQATFAGFDNLTEQAQNKGQALAQATFAGFDQLAIKATPILGNLKEAADAVATPASIQQNIEDAKEIAAKVASKQQESTQVVKDTVSITAGIGKGVDLSGLATELKSAFKENFGGNLQEVGSKLIQLTADIPQYQNLLIKSLSPNSQNLTRIAQTATELYVPQGTPQRRLYESFNQRGGDELTHALIQAVTEPTKESFSKLFASAKNVDIPKVIETYAQKVFTEGGLDLKGALIANSLFKGGKATPQELIGTFATQIAPRDVTFRDQLNERIRDTTGRNIQAGSYSQQAVFDPTTGLQKFSVSAKTADGAIVQLNAHVDEFGHKIIEEPKGITKIREAASEFLRAVPRQLADQFTYGITDAVQTMFRSLVGIQDELAEVANLLGVVGDKASQAKGKFLFQSVQTAVQTGQGFDEAIQTNLKNFKILGSVKDTGKREDLANQISGVQLGAQTAFGISLEQGLEAIPAILSTIKDGMTDIDDPTLKVEESVKRLRGVMDEVVVAQRATGAQGDELITVYSRLAESAKEYGLNSKQLLGITATSSVAIGRGSEETSNILRGFLEGTYSEANQGEFAKAGIATKVFNKGTGQLENRGFEDILRNLFDLSQDKSRGIEYNQLLQSIAGPKVKPDIAKIIAGFGRNYDPTQEKLNQTQQGTFETLVGQKSQNLQGSLNKLSATGTQLFGSFLVGTGTFDKLSKLFDNLSDSAVKLTSFLNDNQDAIGKVVSAIAPFIKFLTIGQLSKDVNIFSPIAKGINAFETTVEATKAKLFDFGAVGEGAPTGLTRTLKLALAVMKEMAEVSQRTGEVLVAEFDKAASTVDRFNNATKGAQGQLASNLQKASGQYAQVGGKPQSQVATGALPELLIAGSNEPTTPIKQRLALAAIDKERRKQEIAAIEQNLVNAAETQKAQLQSIAQGASTSSAGAAAGLYSNLNSETPLSDRIRNRIQSSSAQVNQNIQTGINTVESVISPPQSRLSRLKDNLQEPGAVAGALAAPVAFDVLSGGLGKDNLVNVGTGIAGGIAGAFLGGPFGATVGYSIAKGISENIDISGKLGTSEKEADTLAQRLAQAIFNVKPPDGTPEEKEKNTREAAGQLTGISKRLGIDELTARVNGLTSSAAAGRGKGAESVLNATSEDVKAYLAFQNKNGRGPGFLDNFKLNNNATQGAIDVFGGNKELLNLFAESGVSNVREFIQLLGQAAQGAGPLSEAFTKLSVNTRQQADASLKVTNADNLQAQYQSAQEIIQEGQKAQTDLQSKLQSDYQTPYGLDKYNSFGPLAQGLDKQFAPQLAQINSGALTGQDAQSVLDRLARSQESLANLPQTLQQLVPLAQSLGLNTGGLEQRLYNVGSQGQQQIAQRFAPAIEADRSVQEYEQRQSQLRRLQSTDLFKAKQPEIIKEVEALQKALATDKARYDINKAFLELLKGQSGALLDQTAAVEAQQKTRQLISAGTPAQFTPASIFDTKGTTATELNNAIDFALRKQSKLAALNPEYKKEFAKDQFLLQSGTDFKGVTGVNQGFVQEYLQQQQQRKEAPLQDLSQYSDQQISKILDQARSLQGQAEKLDPARAGKYENERILILKKNNDLLSQTGIGQEFLKAAIDANTKSNDTLRGHYNLPSNYKSPTIFDYYDNGGKEKGDKNFPNAGGTGLVPLAFAQQLAQELINGSNNEKGATLSDVKGANQAGSRPLFYPNPGTAAVYSEVEPVVLPDTIKSDQHISDAVQRFLDFKQAQIDDLTKAIDKAPALPPDNGIEAIRLRNAQANGTVPTSPKTAGVAAAYNQLVNPNVPYFGAPKPADVIQPTTVIGTTGTLPPSSVDLRPSTKPGNTDRDRDLSGPVVEGAAKSKTALTQLSQSGAKTRDDLAILGTNAAKTGNLIGSIATALPAAGVGAASLVTSASSFSGAVSALIQKVQTFDLARALQNANVNIQVTVNGQVTQPAQVVINSGTAVGSNTLTAGPATKTGSKIGNRQ